MNETNQNNQNKEFESETQNPEYSSEQYIEEHQGYYENPYYGGQQGYGNGQQYYGPYVDYNNGQYYGQNTDYDNGQYYAQNTDYNNGQYYDRNADYNNQRYYGQNRGYNNGQYYGQNADYNNGQYYGQNAGYDNGQYYGQNGGYNNGQYYGQNGGYNNGQYYGQNAGYNNQQYYGPQYAYGQPQAMREPVTNVFYYILMALTAASAIMGIRAATSLVGNIFSSMDLRTMAGQGFATMYSSMMYYFVNSPGYSVYSVWNSLLGFAAFTVSIIDIIQVHRKRYPILGLVLFSVLCKPGYFIWRAHVLRQKKLIPVLFVISYILLYVGYFFWCLSYIARFL